MIPILKLFPDWWVRLTSPLFAELGALQKNFELNVESIFSEKGNFGSDQHPTIIHSLRDNPDLPASEKTISRVSAEARGLGWGRHADYSAYAQYYDVPHPRKPADSK